MNDSEGSYPVVEEPILPVSLTDAQDHNDVAGCTATGEDPLNFVSDEDPDHDPFTDYPAVVTDDSESVDTDEATEEGV